MLGGRLAAEVPACGGKDKHAQCQAFMRFLFLERGFYYSFYGYSAVVF
jgi:hypothetical protein